MGANAREISHANNNTVVPDRTRKMRNVRPSWVRVSVASSDNAPAPASVGRTGTGPKGRAGSLSADFAARIDGQSVPFLTVDAIGSADGKSTVWTVTDRRTGTVFFSETVTQ